MVIEKEFQSKTGIWIGSEALHTFLRELTELGALRYENYRYIVKIPGTPVAA